MTQVRRFALAALALAATMLVAAPAAGAMTVRFEGGEVFASGGEGNLVPRCNPSGNVNVSGIRPSGPPVACTRVREIVLRGFDGINLIDLSFAERSDFTRLALVRGYGFGDTDKLIGASFCRNQLYGGSHSDSLTGGNLADALYGGSGSDRLKGLGGADKLVGGPGGDGLEGGPGRDTEIP